MEDVTMPIIVLVPPVIDVSASFSMQSSSIQAKTRKLKTKWSISSAQDLYNIGNIADPIQDLPKIEISKIDFHSLEEYLNSKYEKPCFRSAVTSWIEEFLYNNAVFDYTGTSETVYGILIEMGVVVEQEE
jgi:hypothetical protein